MRTRALTHLQGESANCIGKKALAGVVGAQTRPRGVAGDGGQIGDGIEEDAIEGGDAMIDKRAIRAGVDEQHRPAPSQADNALHEATIERGAFHSAFRQDDIGIDEQRREQLGIGHGRAEHAGGLLAVPIAEHLEALYAGAEERASEGQREIARASSKHAPALEMAEHAPGQLHGRLGQRRRRGGRIRRGQGAGQTGGRRSEPGQGIAQRGRLPRLRQGARPKMCIRDSRSPASPPRRAPG